MSSTKTQDTDKKPLLYAPVRRQRTRTIALTAIGFLVAVTVAVMRRATLSSSGASPEDFGTALRSANDCTVPCSQLAGDQTRHSHDSVPLNGHPSRRLQGIDYRVNFRNSRGPGNAWTQDYREKLLETLKKIPKTGAFQNLPWYVTSHYIKDDIRINAKRIRISSHAFTNARPLLKNRPSQSFFSRRLYMACVRAVVYTGLATRANVGGTKEARKTFQLAHILRERFGVEVSPNTIDYASITSSTTKEDKEKFEAFRADELMNIVAMFEEMPTGFHKLKNLKTLVRRRTGDLHPMDPALAAAAWPNEGANYLEFMDKAFKTRLEFTFQVVLHEKAHFVYANSVYFSARIKQQWNDISGWRQTDNGTWMTDDELTFVSAYAHLKNPNEDFAESLAAYIRQPNKLKSRSPQKYWFIHNHILMGIHYVTSPRRDLTFDVFNLWPDIHAPGPIEHIEPHVSGELQADKTVRITITLVPGAANLADHAYLRLRHSTEPTTKDMHFVPLNPTNGPQKLEGRITLSRFAPSGTWTTHQIELSDVVGNERYVAITRSGAHRLSFEVNNLLEDRTPPEYVRGSLRHNLSSRRGDELQVLTVTWDVQEAHMETKGGCAVKLRPPEYEGQQSYTMDEWGTAVKHAHNNERFTCTVTFTLHPFSKSGTYRIETLLMCDLAGYVRHAALLPQDASGIITIYTSRADNAPPEIDLDAINITARPTSASQPNGETIVTISVVAWDVSESGHPAGVGYIFYTLIDPQDRHHSDYIYHNNFYTQTFEGEPGRHKIYAVNHTLPAGSQNGTWALHSIQIHDKARNVRNVMFTEILQSHTNARVADGNIEQRAMKKEFSINTAVRLSD